MFQGVDFCLLSRISVTASCNYFVVKLYFEDFNVRSAIVRMSMCVSLWVETWIRRTVSAADWECVHTLLRDCRVCIHSVLGCHFSRVSGQSQVRIILTAILLAPASVFNHCLVLSYNDVGLFQFDLIEFFKMYKGYSSVAQKI